MRSHHRKASAVHRDADGPLEPGRGSERHSEASQPPVVFVIGPWPPPFHGASIVTEQVASRLVSRFDVLAVDLTVTKTTSVRYHIGRIAAYLRAVLLLAKTKIGGRRISVYLAGAGGASLWYQALVALAVRACRGRLVYHHHSYAYINSGSTAMSLIAAVSRRFCTHVFLCESMRRDFVDRYGEPLITAVCSNRGFIHGGTPGDRSDGVGPIRLGHLSNLTIEKGLGTIAEAASAVSAIPGVELHIAGPVMTQAAAEALEGLMAHRLPVTYYGPLSREDVPAFLAMVDIFLFPSTYSNEAEPLVVLEALAAGVPVVSTAIGCLGAHRTSEWVADDKFVFAAALLDILGQVHQLSGVTRQEYLKGAAARQLVLFAPFDFEAIVRGLRHAR